MCHQEYLEYLGILDLDLHLRYFDMRFYFTKSAKFLYVIEKIPETGVFKTCFFNETTLASRGYHSLTVHPAMPLHH